MQKTTISGQQGLRATTINSSSNLSMTTTTMEVIATGWSNLWDQTDAVSSHTQKGIEFLERFGQFIKERAMIEEDYATKLRNLVKKSKNKKNDEEECKIYSYMSAFYSILSESESLAAQHEVVGEKMKKEIVPSVLEKAQVLRAGRKKHIAELQALNTSFNDSVENMAKLEKTYGKAFKDAQIAHVKYEKADKNYDLSRLDVERAKNNVHQKNQICEQAKQSYASGLESANQAQHDYYNHSLPNLLEEMRKLDMNRIESTKWAMLESVNAERSVSSIVQRCYSDMESAISTINPEKDTLVVVEQHRSGYSLPSDFRFNDLGCPSQINGDSTVDATTLKRNSGSNVAVSSISKNSNGKGIPRKHSMHQRLFGGPSKSGSSTGANDSYSNLPPQQRCRKIQAKLDELAKEAATKEQSRAGLEKMFGVYKDNPKLGNASDVDQQMKQYAKELEVIYAHVENYRKLLLDAQSELNTPMGGQHENSYLRLPSSYNPSPSSSPRLPPPSVTGSNHLVAVNNTRSSYSGESVSSGVSEGSSSTVPHGAFARPQNITSSSNGFHSISPKVHPSHQLPMQHIDSNSADFYEECDSPRQPASASVTNGDELTPLGTCIAIYGFDGSTDGTTMEMREGDEMLLIEKDEGDGWTRVRHMNSQMEGFVPTSYLQCRWYSAVGKR